MVQEFQSYDDEIYISNDSEEDDESILSSLSGFFSPYQEFTGIKGENKWLILSVGGYPKLTFMQLIRTDLVNFYFNEINNYQNKLVLQINTDRHDNSKYYRTNFIDKYAIIIYNLLVHLQNKKRKMYFEAIMTYYLQLIKLSINRLIGVRIRKRIKCDRVFIIYFLNFYMDRMLKEWKIINNIKKLHKHMWIYQLYSLTKSQMKLLLKLTKPGINTD